MKKILFIILFICTLFAPSESLARFSGSPAGEVTVELEAGRGAEALRAAYVKGLLLGYDERRYDSGAGIVELRRIENDDKSGVAVNYFIRIDLNKNSSPPTISIRGEDMEMVGGATYIRDDIRDIAEAVRGCCGLSFR